MKAKFIKIQDTIVNTNDILSIYRHGQSVIIECKNDIHDIYFSSEFYAEQELNRIYAVLMK
jgi:hypothetical protein